MRPLRIGYLVSRLVAAGAERQMIALAKRLPNDRFEVDFIARTGVGPLDAEAIATGARVHHLGLLSTPEMSRIRRVQEWAARNERYVRLARRERYDIVDAWLYPADAIAVLTRGLTRTPVVLSGRRDTLPRDQLGPLSPPLERAIDRFADGIVANATYVAEHAVRVHGAHPDKVRVIRAGVEPGIRLSESERAATLRSLGLTADGIVVGCVGNYRDMKRHELLIAAFARVAADHPDVSLVLVGEGPMRPAMERQVEDLGLASRVGIHGSVLDPRPLYGAFDIVAQASNSEGMPNVLLEAGAARRAIVATAAGGTSEVVRDGETGLLVPVEDLDALAAALRRLVDDAELRVRLGAAAERSVLAEYGMDRYAREWADYYEERAAAKGVVR